MPTYINADDGIVSGVAGLKYGADNSGSLVLQTNGTTAITISAAQVVTFTNAVNFATASFTNLAYTGTLTGGTGVVNLGSGQFYKDASGNIGLGTTSPATGGKLSVVSAVAQDSARFTDATNYTLRITSGGFGVALVTGSTSSGLALGADGSEKMRISTAGNVGIGTTGPAVRLDVRTASAGPAIQWSDNINSTGFLATVTGASSINSNTALVFGTGTSSPEAMRIDSSGNLLVGTTTPISSSTTFQVSSAKQALILASSVTADSTTLIHCIKSGGTNNTSQRYIQFSYNGGGNGNGAIAGNGDSQATFVSSSDERLKENIVDLPSQLDKVLSLRPVEFDYKSTGGHQIGFIAQEVQDVYPDLVAEGDDGYLTLAGLDKNSARLIKAIQEQQALITDLTTRLNALEGK